MDNIPHSLVGAALAQGAVQYRMSNVRGPDVTEEAKASSVAVLPMYVASILANNFPDLDLMITAVMEARLGYILHHRGHTHTLLFAPLQLLLILGIFWLYARRKKPNWSGADWRWFTGLAVVGCFVHLGMDSFNVYGVHPFWPFDNRWYYGDFVFILEPLFWMALIPWLYTSVRQRWSRNTLITFYTLGYVALFIAYFKMWWYPLGIAVIGLSYGALVVYRLQPRARGWAAFLAMMLLLGSLLTPSLWARKTLTAAVKQAAPQETIHDIALMSYPSNPFCYIFIAMTHNPKTDRYVLRQGIYTYSTTALACPNIVSAQTAPLKKSNVVLKPKVGGFLTSVLMFSRPLAELKKALNHCQLRAALQFIRVPFWNIATNHILVGDLRFDRRKGFDLADFLFRKNPKNCPHLIPPWEPPLKSRGLIK